MFSRDRYKYTLHKQTVSVVGMILIIIFEVNQLITYFYRSGLSF